MRAAALGRCARKRGAPSSAGPDVARCNDARGSGNFRDVSRLRAFLSLNDFELHVIALGERLEAAALDCAVVHENVRPALARDEAEPLRVVEPLYRTGDASHRTFPRSAVQVLHI